MVRSMPGQGSAEGEESAALLERLAAGVYQLGGDSGKRHGGGTRLGGGDAGQRSDHDPAGLGLPPGVHDGAASATDVLVIPDPGFGIDRLADGAEQPQSAEGRGDRDARCPTS